MRKQLEDMKQERDEVIQRYMATKETLQVARATTAGDNASRFAFYLQAADEIAY